MGLLLALILAATVPVETATAAPGLAFVQATVADASAHTLTFVDASGRNRSHPVAAAAVARVGRLRPGDEVIVVLAGSQPVVQDVKMSRASAYAPPAADAPPAPAPEEPLTVVPSHELRPTWPNPYSRFYRGPKPAAPPPQRR